MSSIPEPQWTFARNSEMVVPEQKTPALYVKADRKRQSGIQARRGKG